MEEDVIRAVHALAARFSAERAERQRRRTLCPADFVDLANTGFPLLAVPEEHGGRWREVSASTRPICEALRLLV